jgi:hypothetical protein
VDWRKEVRQLVVHEDDRDGLLEIGSARIGQRPDRAGRIDDVRVAEQHQRVQALLAHQSADTFRSLAAHPAEIRLGRNERRWR